MVFLFFFGRNCEEGSLGPWKAEVTWKESQSIFQTKVTGTKQERYKGAHNSAVHFITRQSAAFVFVL